MLADRIILSRVFVGFVVFLVTFTILNQKWATRPIYAMFLSFLTGFVTSIIISVITTPAFHLLLFVLLLYILLVAVYIFAIYLNIDSSMHMRLLKEFAEKGDKGMTYEELLVRYNKRTVINRRLKWLVDSGEIGQEGDIYYIRRRHSLLWLREKLLLMLEKFYGSGRW